jgi:hypothetical protein
MRFCVIDLRFFTIGHFVELMRKMRAEVDSLNLVANNISQPIVHRENFRLI